MTDLVVIDQNGLIVARRPELAFLKVLHQLALLKVAAAVLVDCEAQAVAGERGELVRLSRLFELGRLRAQLVAEAALLAHKERRRDNQRNEAARAHHSNARNGGRAQAVALRR